MVRDLVRRLNNTYNTIPDAYKQFLSDCGKMSPVTGWLQVTYPGTALDILKVKLSLYMTLLSFIMLYNAI